MTPAPVVKAADEHPENDPGELTSQTSYMPTRKVIAVTGLFLRACATMLIIVGVPGVRERRLRRFDGPNNSCGQSHDRQ